MEKEEIKLLRKKIYIILSIISLITCTLLFFYIMRIYGFSMALGITTIAFSLIAGKTKNIVVHRRIVVD